MRKKILLSLVFLTCLSLPTPILARTTPADIVNSKLELYNQKVTSYSSESKQKLEEISQKIIQINKKRTEELERIVLVQGEILDEYQRRLGEDDRPAYERRQDALDTTRYWITFAHEAIAYQASKVYVFNLNGEGNLKSDILNTINIFQSELEYARGKTIYAKGLLDKTLVN